MPSSSKSDSDLESPEALALLDLAPVGLLQTAEDGTILRANKTFCNWVGYTSEALVGNWRLSALLSMGARIFHQTHWLPLLQMQGSISEVKLELNCADGTTIPMVLNAIRREHNGVVVHDLAAYVARDRDKYERELIASRKRLEILVREAERMEADAKDRAKFSEQMVGIVSHDLRNPLSSIVMAAALLGQDDDLTPRQRRIVGTINRSTERATRLIADLLDFTQARLGSGLSFVMKPIDLHEVMAGAVEELRLLYSTRTIVHVRVGEGECVADAERLTQLVGNLISNAMTYGAVESPVTVTSTFEDGTFSIVVHNQGPPIPKAIQDGLFEPMARGDATTRNAGRGVGLGLFIVREIAEGHGGTARVRSDTGDGTTFTISMPRARHALEHRDAVNR